MSGSIGAVLRLQTRQTSWLSLDQAQRQAVTGQTLSARSLKNTGGSTDLPLRLHNGELCEANR
jgi:hypothetical protein